MEPAGPQLTLLQRHEIEAGIVGPLIRAFASEVEERALGPRALGHRGPRGRGERTWRGSSGASTLEAFAQALDRWSEGGALEIEVLERSPTRLSFNVTRAARYADAYGGACRGCADGAGA